LCGLDTVPVSRSYFLALQSALGMALFQIFRANGRGSLIHVLHRFSISIAYALDLRMLKSLHKQLAHCYSIFKNLYDLSGAKS
jgi:hypothetical protein